MYKLKLNGISTNGEDTELNIPVSETMRARITNYSFDIYVNDERVIPSEYCAAEYLLVDPITEEQYLDPAIFTNVRSLEFKFQDYSFSISYMEIDGLHSMRCQIKERNIDVEIWEQEMSEAEDPVSSDD